MSKKYSFLLVMTGEDCGYRRSIPLTDTEAKLVADVLEKSIISNDGQYQGETRIVLDDKLEVDEDGNIIIPNGMEIDESLHLVAKKPVDPIQIKMDEKCRPFRPCLSNNRNMIKRH